MSRAYIIFLFVVLFFLAACREKQDDSRVVTPWGEVQTDSIPETADFTFRDIITGGEMIMLTLSGPETYYDYHGRGMGAQFLLCEKFAQSIGVSLRVELCKDTLEMIHRLQLGEADLIAFPLPKQFSETDSLRFCGMFTDSLQTAGWAVLPHNGELAQALDHWFQPDMLEKIKQEERQLLTQKRVHRRVFSPFLNRQKGQISKFDYLFQKYAAQARWDWRLMAAQCYQESCFDPNARSWAGARGLMQIMPSTAAHLGLSMDKIHSPEPNIAAAAKYIQELMATFKDIPNFTERQYFVLAAYNGGSNHVRDAMVLTRKHGGNPQRWGDVAPNMMLLREPAGYNDPVVKYGYMRANETVDYVEKIRERYAQYRGVPFRSTTKGSTPTYQMVEPRKAKKQHKYHVQ